MPITVLNNAEGFNEGVDSANKIYDRINSYAQNQMNLAAQARVAAMQAASRQYEALAPAFARAKLDGSTALDKAWGDIGANIDANRDEITKAIGISPTFDSPVPGQTGSYLPVGNEMDNNLINRILYKKWLPTKEELAAAKTTKEDKQNNDIYQQITESINTSQKEPE